MRFYFIQQYREWKCKEHLWRWDDIDPYPMLKPYYWYRCERCGKSKAGWGANLDGKKGELI